jgi:putative Mg2+ transporter-C (MgtC) family protein
VSFSVLPFAASVPTLSWEDALLRLVLAGALGGAIGFERELREREAGLRTHMLVSVGAALFTVVSAYGFTSFIESGTSTVRTDPTRIAAQIVTGIGFLGAGAIIRMGLSVRGLTTAASLWVVAAIGMAAGAGYWEAALITTGLVLLFLWPVRIFAYRLLVMVRPEEGRLAVELEEGGSAAPVLEELERLHAEVDNLEIHDLPDGRSLLIAVRYRTSRQSQEATDRIAGLSGVRRLRWVP